MGFMQTTGQILRRKKKCKNCDRYFRPHDNAAGYVKWCTDACREKLGVKAVVQARLMRERSQIKAKRAQKKVNARKKAEFKKKDIRVRKPAAKKSCHSYIKERDKDELCICCNKPLGPDYQAGHWLESGNNPQVRYDENNIHAQRLHCNYYKGGDSGDYEKNLRIKIGNAAVDELLTKKGGTVKRTAEDYVIIEAHFKKKIKELESIK